MQSHVEMEEAIREAGADIERLSALHDETKEARYLDTEADANARQFDTARAALTTPAATLTDLAAKHRIFADRFEAEAWDFGNEEHAAEFQAFVASIGADLERLTAT
jgi:predicted phage gp36 major capsid-like protein